MPSKDLNESKEFLEVLYMTPEVDQNDVPLGVVVEEPEQNPPYGICLFDSLHNTYRLLHREIDVAVAIAAINDIVNQIT